MASVVALPAPAEHAFDLSELDINVSSNRGTQERFDCLQVKFNLIFAHATLCIDKISINAIIKHFMESIIILWDAIGY